LAHVPAECSSDGWSAPMNATCSRMYTPPPTMIAEITARGTSRAGLRASPASCTACSNPSSENTMPPVGIAMKIDLNAAPLMKNPPSALKFDPWNLKISRTMIVSTGIMSFQVVRMLFTLASQRTPIRFTQVKRSIKKIASGMPTPRIVVPL
jgi:hypothetical protein